MTFASLFEKLSQKLAFKSQKELTGRTWPYTTSQREMGMTSSRQETCHNDDFDIRSSEN